MHRMISFFLSFACYFAAFLSLPSALKAETGFTEQQEESIEKIIKNYLLKNPDIVRDALIELETREIRAQEKKRDEALVANAEKLFRSPLAYVAGNPKGDITVVEFFDYNCSFCKRAVKDILKLIEADKNVRVVFKEFPIFGAKSEEAARLALAAIKQGKYLEVHFALLEEPGQADEQKGLEIAQKLGLDTEQLKKDMQDPSIDEAIEEARTVGDAIGVRGTPLYLVGDQIISGAPEDLYDQFVSRLEVVRKTGCKKMAC